MQSLLTRTAVVGATAALAVLVTATPAAAHVTISATDTVAGAYTLLTVSVPHGCEGEATTAIAIQIPEPLNAVTPSANPGWDVEKVMVDLPEPIADSHGNEITERVDQVVYTAKTPLPDGIRDAFELSLRLPEETAGQTLYFPVVQTCTGSDHPWIEIPAEGQNPDEIESPAPSITVAADAEDAAAEPAAVVESSEEDGSGFIAYLALGVAVVGTALAAFALVRGRRQA
ncbi:YcnI family protein [Glycomyces sp. NPDC046736]|uniref:YcnI family copper-binding membrane protein n=1 Tax=Glycomyces sp. NPDC046736 TaxID=3155615 RepID=UPI0033FE0CFA